MKCAPEGALSKARSINYAICRLKIWAMRGSIIIGPCAKVFPKLSSVKESVSIRLLRFSSDSPENIQPCWRRGPRPKSIMQSTIAFLPQDILMMLG